VIPTASVSLWIKGGCLGGVSHKALLAPTRVDACCCCFCVQGMCVNHDTCGIRVVWIKASRLGGLSYKALLHPLLEPALPVFVLLTRGLCCAVLLPHCCCCMLLTAPSHVPLSDLNWSCVVCKKCWGVTGTTQHGLIVHQIRHGEHMFQAAAGIIGDTVVRSRPWLALVCRACV
jgi:hypothetical protein